jgi:acyl carrier protein
MENQQIFDKLNSIVKSINVNAAINENTALVGDSVLDSLEFMNYITKVEEAFKINISDSEIIGQQLGILHNMTNYISSKTNKN